MEEIDKKESCSEYIERMKKDGYNVFTTRLVDHNISSETKSILEILIAEIYSVIDTKLYFIRSTDYRIKRLLEGWAKANDLHPENVVFGEKIKEI